MKREKRKYKWENGVKGRKEERKKERKKLNERRIEERPAERGKMRK